MTKKRLFCIYTVMFLLVFSFSICAKVKQFGPSILLRPVTIRNVAYSSTGKLFAVPNFITAGSVGVFSVSENGRIASLPARLSERDFIRSAGVFYFKEEKENAPVMAFLPLPELLSGYSVSFFPGSDTLAIAGGDKVLIYETKNWKLVRSVTVTQNTTRVVFSPDGSMMAAVAGNKIYVLNTRNYSLMYMLYPEASNIFADVTFSGDNEKLAVFEYKNIVLDHAPRVRLYMSRNGTLDRDLPYFSEKITSAPGNHFPLLSFSPKDSAIAVTLEKSLRGKTVLIKSNDGTHIREFKGFCHAFSPDGSLFAGSGKVYSTSDWKELGRYGSSALCVSFSPTERALVVVSPETIKRYRIE